MSFTTYVTTWGPVDPVSQVRDMITKGALKPGCRIVLAFASFNFDGAAYIPGLVGMTMDAVKTFTNVVRAAGGRVSLSIGGATYPLAGSDLYSQPGVLASNINTVLMACGFDGVDFDIEDSYATAPANFASTAASLINTLRSLNAGLYISLTTPAQAWAAGMYQQSLLNLTVGNLNCWQPMEYDLWIDAANTYSAQVQWDINYYMKTWSVPASKIVLVLMPGSDDMNHVLSLQDALNLTSFAKGLGLQGVMTWDLNNDARGIAGNAPYAYTMGMQTLLKPAHCAACARLRGRGATLRSLRGNRVTVDW